MRPNLLLPLIRKSLKAQRDRLPDSYPRSIRLQASALEKHPTAVVAKHIGEGAIVEQAVNNLVDEIYPQAIEEAEIKPYGPGSLENMPEMDPPTFEFLVPLEPEVTLSKLQRNPHRVHTQRGYRRKHQ